MMRRIRQPNLVLMLLLGPYASLQAATEQIPIRHLIGTNESTNNYMTAGLCPFVYSTSIGALCSLVPDLRGKGARIDVEVLAKVDESAYDDYAKLENDPTEEHVQRIFSEKRFNSASGIATMTSFFGSSALSFTPIRLVQTYFINNPVFPEVHYAGAQDSVLRIHHVFKFDVDSVAFKNRNGHVYLGAYPWMVQRERIYLDADLSDVLAQRKLQKKVSSLHQDLNLAARYVPGMPWFRGVTLQLLNLNSQDKCKACQDYLLDIDLDTRFRWHVSMDFGGEFPVGAFLLAAGVERQVEEGSPSPAKLNLMATYKLTSFGLFCSFNETMTRTGFLYEGDSFKSGIVYTNEKQVNALRFERKNEVFLVLGTTL